MEEEEDKEPTEQMNVAKRSTFQQTNLQFNIENYFGLRRMTHKTRKIDSWWHLVFTFLYTQFWNAFISIHVFIRR